MYYNYYIALVFQHRPIVDDARKSSSLQMLAHGDGVLPPVNSPIGNESVAGTESGAAASSTKGDKAAEEKGAAAAWTTPERIGGKISAALANESSANNSGRGSRSSGLQVGSSEFWGYFNFKAVARRGRSFPPAAQK